MKIFQEEVLQQFNHFYKELDDLYHEISTAVGLSDDLCTNRTRAKGIISV